MSAQRSIAVVGIGCRLPGGISSPNELVTFLRNRGDAVIDVPRERWHTGLHHHPDPRVPGKSYVKRASFLQADVFAFDPEPFGISPREAEQLDPQQRLLLETSWEAFEDAGISIHRLRGSNTAVFVGGFTLDHQTLAYAERNRLHIGSHTSTGSSLTMLSNRLSYTFDLRGPSMTIDTACSSSLVATHLACESLKRGEAELALAGGVTVMLSPTTMTAMSKGHFLAPDGRSKTFDARADGYGRGEGAAVVILKRLDAALRDGDRIYALIAATGVNQDGRTDGIAMPSESAQRELSARVLALSGLRAADIGYVEAHGTGTRAGDPIEVRALGAVYGRQPGEPLLVGSIKTNIGHLEAAAGVTGLIKAALSIQNLEIYPLRELGSINDDIDFAALNLRPAVQVERWPDRPIVAAAVNAFGYGGTNAHAVLTQAPMPLPWRARVGFAAPRTRLVPLSAASRAALSQSADRVAGVVDRDRWLDQAYTLAHHRAHLPERAIALADSAESLQDALGSLARNEPDPRVVQGRATGERRLLWVYTGMGPQWWAMGRELYAAEPTFRQAVERADQAFAAASGESILARMLADEALSTMSSNAVAQPANFVLQVGLTELLRGLGVPQDGVLGHSVGEVAAAWAAGCLTLAQAARLTFERSRLQQKLAGRGTMLAAAISVAEATVFVETVPGIVIAAYNAPQSLALAGDRSGLQRIARELDARGVFNRMMPVEIAYHSPQMESLRSEMLEAFGELAPQAPQRVLYSTLLGERVSGARHDAEYFWRNARAPVLLQSALEAACADGYSAFLELGPHPVLAPAIREVVRAKRLDGRTFHTLKRGKPEQDSILRNVAELHVCGVALDWNVLFPSGRRVDLPTYAFQRERYWIESPSHRDWRTGSTDRSRVLSRVDAGPNLGWTVDLTRADLSYLEDHRIQDTTVFPAAGFLDAALGASAERHPGREQYVLEAIEIERAMILRSGEAPTLALELDRDGSFELHGRHEGQAWERHAFGRTVPDASYRLPEARDLAELAREVPGELDVAQTYVHLQGLGLQYGPQFRRICELRVAHDADGGGRFLARLAAEDLAGEASALHPSLLDSAFQGMLAACPELDGAMVPVAIGFARHLPGVEVPTWAYGRVGPRELGRVVGELVLMDSRGQVCFEARDIVCRTLEARVLPAVPPGRWIHEDVWREIPWPAQPSARSGDPLRCVLLGDAPLLGSLADVLEKRGARVKLHALHELPVIHASTTHVVLAFDPEHTPAQLTDICARAVAAAVQLRSPALLRVVTTRAHRVDERDRVQPTQSALWGVGRVLMTERPELSCRLVDVDPSVEITRLAELLFDPECEEEVAARGSKLVVRRLVRTQPHGELDLGARRTEAVQHDGAYRLVPGASEPTFEAVARRVPNANELELVVDRVQVHATDARPRAPWPLRANVGRVVRVGRGVEQIKPGDSVLVLDRREPTSHLTVAASRAVVVPAAAACAVASTDLIVAWHALMDTGRLRAGERVLLHGVRGALALACARIARSVGAHVVATVSSADEASALDAAGVELVASAQSLDFAAQLEQRFGDSIQLVVNMLAEPARSKGFELLRSGGRFVELGSEPAIKETERLRVRSGIAYCRADLEGLIRERPAHYAALVATVLDTFAPELAASHERRSGTAASASFAELWRASADSRAQAAFTLELSRRDAVVSVDLAHDRLFRDDRTYLVTGGLSGFGLETAEWLVQRGAAHLVLAGRRPPDARARAVMARLRRAGVQLEARSVDITQPDAVDDLLAYIRGQRLPLGGVFHSAMVLEDRPLDRVDAESLARVLTPKALGAWLLFTKTEPDALDHFVLYSSVSALVGNPNQASYAAANAFLDGLAELGRTQGRSVTSVSFGALGDTGVVARDSATQAHLLGLGFGTVPAKLALSAVEWSLRSSRSRIGIIEASWDRWMSSFPQTPWNRLTELAGDAAGSGADPLAQLRRELQDVEPAERDAALSAKVRVVAAQVFRLHPERIDAQTSLKTYGLDSLMAVELQSTLDQHFGLVVPTMQLLAGLSIDELKSRLSAKLEAGPQLDHEAERPGPTRVSDLRARLLASICVQPPYFDLCDIEQRGEWVTAMVEPTAPGADEDDAVSCAEAARHLAIVGSCAVSLACPIAGKVYYPVRRAEHVRSLVESNAWADSSAALERVIVRGRCIELELDQSRAAAETELCDLLGNVLYTLRVDYHIIPEADFARLFAEQARSTEEDSAANPYLDWTPIGTCERDAGVFRCDLGRIDALDCLGHFVGYPALPVSIMTRRAIQLTAEAFRQSTDRPGARIRVLSGTADTHAFVFAGERASITACRQQADSTTGIETWSCEVLGPRGPAARFMLTVEARWSHVSGVQLVKPVGRTG